MHTSGYEGAQLDAVVVVVLLDVVVLVVVELEVVSVIVVVSVLVVVVSVVVLVVVGGRTAHVGPQTPRDAPLAVASAA
jgi:hypothetical protein